MVAGVSVVSRDRIVYGASYTDGWKVVMYDRTNQWPRDDFPFIHAPLIDFCSLLNRRRSAGRSLTRSQG